MKRLHRIGRAAAIAAFAAPALAHEGHGLAASHWHATDAVGILLVVALAGLAAWLSRGGK